MIILSIANVKQFMSNLFIRETFDEWLVSEAVIATCSTFCISGQLNKEFFNDEELALLENRGYSQWKLLRPSCFGIIKGNKPPVMLKLVFLLPKPDTDRLLASSSSALAPEDINGLFANIRYEHGRISVTTGSSVSTFTSDKSLDEAFEDYVKRFLTNSGIAFEQI